MKSRCANIGAFFSTPYLHHAPCGFSDTKKRRAVPTANGVSLGCTESGRQPSAICAKLGIPSSFRRPRLPYGTYALREAGIVNIPEARSRKASNKREKIKNYGYHT
ncbi:hypothetical protein NXY02_17340 [Bacteroides fragilis]|nr:hypothetical protein [Bacteroides fragilis]